VTTVRYPQPSHDDARPLASGLMASALQRQALITPSTVTPEDYELDCLCPASQLGAVLGRNHWCASMRHYRFYFMNPSSNFSQTRTPVAHDILTSPRLPRTFTTSQRSGRLRLSSRTMPGAVVENRRRRSEYRLVLLRMASSMLGMIWWRILAAVSGNFCPPALPAPEPPRTRIPHQLVFFV
jgi:hypothetical protein